MKSKKIFPLIIPVLLAAGLILLGNPSIKQNQTIQSSSTTNKQISILRETVKVLRVVDGDTIKVLINNKEDTVRLIGIDAPETVALEKPVQCFGKQASDKAKKALTGKEVVLESDLTQGERDEYGRLLRYVFVDSLNFNQIMVSDGYAREYTFKGKAYKYQIEFVQAEQQARKDKEGIWSACEN